MKNLFFVFLLTISVQSIYSQCDQCDPLYLQFTGECAIFEGCSDPAAINYSGDNCANNPDVNIIEEVCEYPCTCEVAFNFGQSGNCLVATGGCSDPTAENYSGDNCASATFFAEECQYGSVELGEFSFTVTDANMTVQVSADIVTFNGEEPPVGSLLGAFFTNDSGELQCAGYREWTGDQLAIPVWASESGLDNGFAAGELITWGLSIGGQSFAASSSSMNSSPPFSDTFVANGFGQVISAEFTGELTAILGCTDDTAFNYNINATIDDGSCYNLVWEVPQPLECNLSLSITPTGPVFSTVTFNDNSLPIGSLIGVFYLNEQDQYICSDYTQWTGENIALAVWGTESGFDNGFDIGEEMNIFVQIYGQSFQPISPIEFLDQPPFTGSVYSCNGLANLSLAAFEGEITSNPEHTYATACNYDISATVDDGSCYDNDLGCGCDQPAAQQYYDCTGDCLNDTDGDGICNELAPCPNDSENEADGDGVCESDEVNGCTDSQACNYNESATEDDGACIQPTTWYFDTDGDGFGDARYRFLFSI